MSAPTRNMYFSRMEIGLTGDHESAHMIEHARYDLEGHTLVVHVKPGLQSH